ncbi:hypothetical protein C4K68_03295 [Pokkaliibacter plantistimulans]|uniref:XapX domain-containing protein n=1 Tax=Proteobacteria bacterium 228 TaxID=2083153 RepID=A0A2S5KW15_9PROT|nr:hypothetical protein C4K68_03295 [Pokkaliibacter plantistimulans]
MDVFYAALAGLAAGLFFSWLKVPLPAPPTLRTRSLSAARRPDCVEKPFGMLI